MTRKEYELISSSIKKSRLAFETLKIHPDYQVELMVQDLARTLRQTNERFDFDRFVAACGVAQ